MMATEIIEIDAPLAEKWTKTRVSFLSAPTVHGYLSNIFSCLINPHFYRYVMLQIDIYTMTINTPTFIVTLLQPKLESDRRGPSSSSLSGDSRFCGEKLAAVAALVGVLFAWFWEKLDELNMLTWARDREGRGGHDLE